MRDSDLEDGGEVLAERPRLVDAVRDVIGFNPPVCTLIVGEIKVRMQRTEQGVQEVCMGVEGNLYRKSIVAEVNVGEGPVSVGTYGAQGNISRACIDLRQRSPEISDYRQIAKDMGRVVK